MTKTGRFANMPAKRQMPPAPEQLTDKQRDQLVNLVRDDPYRGLVAAARKVGVTGSKGEIRQLLDQDEPFQDALHDARTGLLDEVPGLRVQRLFQKLGDIVENDDSSSQLRAVTFGLGLRGIHADEPADVSVQVQTNVLVEDRSAPLSAVAEVLHAVHAAADSRGTARPALSAASEVLAEPPPG